MTVNNYIEPNSPTSESTNSTESNTEYKEDFIDSTMYLDSNTSYDSVLPHYRHQWIDVYNTKKKKWYETQIIDMDFIKQIMLLHYKGLNNTYHQWIPCEGYSYNDSLIQPLHTHTKPTVYNKYADRNIKYSINDQCDVLDEYDRWQTGTIIDTDTLYYQYCIQYIDSKRNNITEWLNNNSYRIAPYNTQNKNIQIVNVQHYDTPKHTHTQQSSHSPKSHQIGYTTTDNNELKFRRALQNRLGFDIIEQIPDGNCLFRSVSHQIYGTAEYHTLVRTYCMQYIQSEAAFFTHYITEPFHEYIERMLQDGQWGDHVEIQAMSEIYDRPIEIYAYSTQPFKTFNANSNTHNTKPIRISYHFASHYNSVIDATHTYTTHTDTPGTIEQHAIHRSQLLNATGTTRTTNDSDVQLTDHIQFQSVLDQSRQQFNLQNQTEYDVAVTQSLHELNSDTDNALEAARTESLREFETQQQVNEAIALSTQSTSTSAATSNTIHNSTSNLEEQNIARVLAESLKSSQHSTTHTTSNDDLPEPVKQCMELGFDLEQCITAYNIFNDNSGNHDEITQQMSAYLFAAI